MDDEAQDLNQDLNPRANPSGAGFPGEPAPLAQARTLYGLGRHDELLALAEAVWSDRVAARDTGPDGHVAADGEVMRIASLVARHLGDDRWPLWLARARSLFTQRGASTGLAMAMLVDVYEIVDTRGADATALGMLDAVELAVGEDDELYERSWTLGVVAEKRGVVLGELAVRERDSTKLSAARAAYERAVALAPRDARRRLRTAAALVSLALAFGEIDEAEAIGRLETVERAASEGGETVADIRAHVEENLVRLRRGSVDLVSYGLS